MTYSVQIKLKYNLYIFFSFKLDQMQSIVTLSASLYYKIIKKKEKTAAAIEKKLYDYEKLLAVTMEAYFLQLLLL